MRVYLIGYMASGKSKLGLRLADLLGFDFIDLDDLFESRYRISIPDFFEKYGEPAFRDIETSLLKETVGYDDAVISTGGGTPCFHGNMEFINSQGISVYLQWNVHDLAERLKHIRRKRPLLSGIGEEMLEAYVASHLESRIPFYHKATLTVDGANIDTDKIVALIRNVLTETGGSGGT